MDPPGMLRYTGGAGIHLGLLGSTRECWDPLRQLGFAQGAEIHQLQRGRSDAQTEAAAGASLTLPPAPASGFHNVSLPPPAQPALHHGSTLT